jgi:hypothetical protein
MSLDMLLLHLILFVLLMGNILLTALNARTLSWIATSLQSMLSVSAQTRESLVQTTRAFERILALLERQEP